MITTFSGAPTRKRHLGRGEVLARPVPAVVVGQPNVAFLGQEGQKVVRWHAGQRIAAIEGQLEGCARTWASRTCRLVGSRRASSGETSNRYSGMGGHELVDGAGAGDEDGDRRFAPSARATHLLPGRGDGARDSRPGSTRPAGRYRCPAPARWSTPRRAPHPTAGPPRCRAAPSAGNRRGSRGCA